MESSRKRKVLATPSSTENGSASKKIRLLNSAPRNIVQDLGQTLINQLRNSKDKNGHLIATQFVELPPRDVLPDYYEFTKLPIALETIEDKLKRNTYPTMTALESDFKRLIQNAKSYNDPKSEIYENAERIRKLVYNYMKINNPQYTQDPNYISYPTPVPGENGGPVQNGSYVNGEDEVDSKPANLQESEKPQRAVSKTSEPPVNRKVSLAPSGGEEDDVYTGGNALDLTGMSFQDAQQNILSFLLHFTDSEGLEIYTPFTNLPSRKLEDYYQFTKHPVSIKGVGKRVRGVHGRAPPTNVTDFKTWDAFEEEVSFIWRNAQSYNEEGSDMYILADEFKQHFQSLMVDARAKVDEPARPSIKLGGPKPKVTLNLNQHRNSPAPAVGVQIDNEALARQKQMVNAGVNGQQHARPGPMTNGNARSSTYVPTIEARPTTAGSPSGLAVKPEKALTPAMSNSTPAAHTLTNGMMPPPSMRPPSGSPFPAPPTSSYTFTAPAFLPPLPTRHYPAEAALLPTVTIQTHPQLPLPTPYHLNIPPHPTLSHQSTTITLPITHYYIQINPTISKELSMGRPYKLFVTLNGLRLNQRDTQFHADNGRRTHVYDGTLMQGVNRVEVEVAAQKAGQGEGGERLEERGLDVEKVTAFVNLMRG
ncbi:hypothetical protein LTR62_006551 [Meristemomyces frigidus]|uniref:Bromo domain-containing protein n=1 Tax=Meristemomyces frigidus TaxID=1508187 RepID=A0AAN7TBY6_9PEZI|nr:hypothetical protein LTR62_006551 [Meristemomyces frigidus]